MRQFQLCLLESSRVGLHQHLLQGDADLVAHCREAVFSTSVTRYSRHGDLQPGTWSNTIPLPTSKAAPREISRIGSVPSRIWPPPALAPCGFHRSKPRARTTGARGNELPVSHCCYGCCVDELYLHSRTHLALVKDAPEPRPIQPPELGPVIEQSQVGGLHHRYERRAA